MKTARCSSCQAEIVWAINPQTGRKVPLDAEPAERPNGTYYLDDSTDPPTATPARGSAVYLNHFITCPSSEQHRKPRPLNDAIATRSTP